MEIGEKLKWPKGAMAQFIRSRRVKKSHISEIGLKVCKINTTAPRKAAKAK